MKTLCLSGCLLMFLSTYFRLFGQNGPPPCDDFVTIEGRYFKCNGQLFYPLVLCYQFSATHSDEVPDEASDYFLSRTASYGPCTWHCTWESFNENDALAEINNDFSVIHQMGFNALRTAFISPFFEYEKPTASSAFFYCPNAATKFVLPAVWTSRSTWGGHCMEISTDPDPDPYRDRYFQFIQQILEVAEENDLKVILDVAYTKTTVDSHFQDYLNYLELLTNFILSLPENLQKTLMAYVIVEEPYWEGQAGQTKHSVCTKVRDMYNLIKSIDTTHLITIGGDDLMDILEWDPAVMTVDFWCPHIYPYPVTAVEENSDAAVNRVKGQIYWLKNNCPIPWMIGETSFAAIDDEIMCSGGTKHYPEVNGELENPAYGEIFTQKSFAQDISKMVRDCNGSGFSWWQFQEVLWAKECSNLKTNGYGLLRHGEASANYNLFKKPVVEVFEGYLDANGQPPPVDPQGGQIPLSYYDPYNNAVHNPSLKNAVEGYVYNNVSPATPINDAYIQGWNWLWTEITPPPSQDTIYHYKVIHSFSDSDGYFKIAPFNDIDPQDNRMVAVRISAIGAERYSEGSWKDIQMNTNIGTINLDQAYFNKVTGITISSGYQIFQGWNSLHLSDITVNKGASAEFTARLEITANPEFIAEHGSEVHIFTSETFPSCDALINFQKCAPIMHSESVDILNRSNHIDLYFNAINNIKIYPNPSSGVFIFKVSSATSYGDYYTISITDLLGNLLFLYSKKTGLQEIMPESVQSYLSSESLTEVGIF